ncbi:MAG: ATP-binding protein [Bacteroidia bacterium]|jgi:predicted ATPase|nr:ATP-binding protein [Bacteroidia bacterium]
MEKLVITKFGQLENITFDVKDFTVLIGPQASGKSTIGKLVYIFKSVFQALSLYTVNRISLNEEISFKDFTSSNIRQNLDRLFTSSSYRKNTKITFYYQSDFYIDIENKGDINIVTFSSAFESKLDSIEDKYYEIINSTKFIENSKSKNRFEFIVDFLWDFIPSEFEFSSSKYQDVLYIPSGRSIVSVSPDLTHDFKNIHNNPIIDHFIQRVSIYRNEFSNNLEYLAKKNNINLQENLIIQTAINKIKSILSGEFKYDNNGGEITSGDAKVMISQASSGQQESLWILLLIYIQFIYNKSQNCFLIIEEPEANLFPKAQVEIAELIALLANNSNTKLFITTHSPYVLASFNNLIYAYQKSRIDPVKTDKIVPKSLWLNIEHVYAGYLENGKLEDIIDTEINQIKNEMVDTASRKVNNSYDQLFDID